MAAATMLLAVFAGAAYLVALHALVVGGSHPDLALALILAPWAVAAVTSWVRGRRAAAAAMAGVVAIVGLFAGWAPGGPGAHVEGLVYLENLFFVGSLSWLFGRSLAGDRTPLVTRLAAVTRHGDMPPPVLRYTRRVTLGWAVFFAFEAALSSLLYFTQPVATWSTFVNLLQWPLVVVASGIEYGIRRSVLRGIRHSSPVAGFRSFARRDDLARDEHVGEAR